MTISGNEARRNRTTPEAAPSEAPLSVSAVTLPFEKGEVIAQKYRVECLLGSGGIGFVIAATHVDRGERLALKFLRSEFVTHPEAVRRFASEASHAARIRSDHVARVFDVGSLPDGAPFIVMEYLEGTDLHRLLHDEGPLAADRAVGYVVEACEALAAAHACYIVHRDIKPDNLFLAKQPQGGEIVKVLDFGISKAELDATLHEDSVAAPRQTVGALGSPSYMAPEQIRSAADVDGRADIWSLGCVLYELLTKQFAFDAPSLMQTCAQVLESEPVPLRSHRPDVPEDLEAVVMRCLEKDPARRFQDLGELARALTDFAPPHALPSIEKTVELVRNARHYSAEDAPSSRVVRSRPRNDRPPVDESTVRPLPRDIDAEWEAIAADRDRPSLRSPVPVPSEPKSASVPGEIVHLKPLHTGAATQALERAVEPAAAGEANAGDAIVPPPASAPEKKAPPAEPTRPRGARPLDTTPSIIIQDPPQPAPWLEPTRDTSSWKRSLAPLWIALALAVAGIVGIEWRVWSPSLERSEPQAVPRPLDPTTSVAGTSLPPPVPPPAEATAEREQRGTPDGQQREAQNVPPAPPPRTPRTGATGPWRAPARSPNMPKIAAIAQKVELASEDDANAATPDVEPPPNETAPAPEREKEPSAAQFGAIVPSEGEASRVEPSPIAPAPAPPRTSATFPSSEVERIVREHADEIQACYDRAAMEHPDLQGRITLRAVIDEHGVVASASASSIEDGARLSACIAQHARRWRFPEPPSGTRTPISYTFVFD